MIQRKQSLFLLIAAALTIVAACMPQLHWALVVVLALTALISLYTIFAFNNRRTQSRLCSLNLLLTLGWYALWAVLYLGCNTCAADACAVAESIEACAPASTDVCATASTDASSTDACTAAACPIARCLPAALPLLAAVFVVLARRAIIADEKLVRSIDRIR